MHRLTEYQRVRLQEVEAQQKKKFNLKGIAFEQQLKFIEDEARLKALFCTRRAAKSFTGGLYLVREALSNPGCNCLYIGLTRQSAHGIIWKDILRELDTKFNLNIKFNETLLTATLPNGSVIWVTGADTDEQEMNKLLGRKYKLVVLDEASMFTVNMQQLVYGILKPATADQRGTICLLGTSSNITRGLFYDITTLKEPGWSLHTWTAYQNPHVATQWQEEIDDIKKNRPLFMETALFRQWYLNQWVIDEDAKVYKFSNLLNQISALPVFDSVYHYVLGVDLGHSPDPSAFVVGAYNEACSNILFICHAEKHLKMDVTDVANKIKALDAIYHFDTKIIDGSNKMAVEELNIRHKVNVIPADKLGKEHFINLMNAELIQRRIQLTPQAKELAAEMDTLVWVTDNGKVKEPRKEHSSLPNHLCDAALYMWRFTFTYLHSIPEKPQNPRSQEVWEPAHLHKLAEQVRRDQNPQHWDNYIEPDEGLFDFSQDDGI